MQRKGKSAMKADETAHENEEEAERLRQLPRAEQRAIVAMHWIDARNPKIPKRDRQFARQRAMALERLLRLRKGRKA